MGRHSSVAVSQVVPASTPGRAVTARKRPAIIIPVLSFLATFGLVLVAVVDPYSGTYAAAAVPPSQWQTPVEDVQSVDVAGEYTVDFDRDTYKITDPPKVVVPSIPAAGNPDPGSAKAIAKAMLTARGWGENQYNCLVALWNKESGWNVNAHNASSGAHGIPQALPGNKMASVGADWATSAKTQITWGLGYIQGRYQTPCGAYTHSQAKNWY